MKSQSFWRKESIPHVNSDGSLRVVLIVGASSGVGKCLVEQMMKKSCRVYCTARDPNDVTALSNTGVTAMQLDVTSDESVQTVVRELISKEGRLDVFVSCVGSVTLGMVETLSMVDLQKEYDVNVFGSVRCVQAIVPHMRAKKSGRIILLTAGAAQQPTVANGAFSSSKSALANIAVALRQELRDFGIQVIQVEPGHVKTSFEKKAMESLKKYDVPEDYSLLQKSVLKITGDFYAKAPGPESTCDQIMSATWDRQPKNIYKTAMDNRLHSKVHSWVSAGVYDSMVMREFKKAAKTDVEQGAKGSGFRSELSNGSKTLEQMSPTPSMEKPGATPDQVTTPSATPPPNAAPPTNTTPPPNAAPPTNTTPPPNAAPPTNTTPSPNAAPPNTMSTTPQGSPEKPAGETATVPPFPISEPPFPISEPEGSGNIEKGALTSPKTETTAGAESPQKAGNDKSNEQGPNEASTEANVVISPPVS
eukprot:Selendium_serpulae@DN6257_c0_g1_i4.p1